MEQNGEEKCGKQSFLKRIQKTAFASNSVHVRGLNIRDLAKKINFKGGKKGIQAAFKPTPSISTPAGFMDCCVAFEDRKSAQMISDAPHPVFFHCIQRITADDILP